MPTERSASAPQNIAHVLALEAHLLGALSALRAAAIPVIVLKGVPLARRLHGHLGARRMVDNDLLVRDGDVSSAVEVLRELGYEDWPGRPLSVSRAYTFQHLMTRSDPVLGRAVVEVHWTAFTPDLFEVPAALQWERVESVRVRDVEVGVFDKPMTLVHLAAHLAQHHLTELRILSDISAAWRRWGEVIDPAELVELADATSTRDVLAWALSVLGLPLPPGLETPRTRLFARFVRVDWLRSPSPHHRYLAMLSAVAMVSPRRFPHWLAHNAFPPVEQLGLIHPNAAARWLWLRYLARPFRPLLRVVRRR